MPQVEIRVDGHLDQFWAEWLEDLSFTYTEEGETILTGTATDQAALFGLIAKLRDMGVKLIAVSYGDQPLDKS